MVALIHDNTQFPEINTRGLILGPGKKHRISFAKKTTYFLPSPYTTCTNQIPITMQLMFDQFNDADYVYGQTICYQDCTQVYLYVDIDVINEDELTKKIIF
jgi:Amiloride-sensitive sodium channel